MRFGRHEFKPGLWPSIATLLVFPLLLSLGFWQLDRAAEKAELQSIYDSRFQSQAIRLNTAIEPDDADVLHWRPVELSGHYEASTYLLDNQVRDQQPGYNIYTVLRLTGSDRAVLIDRGWLAGGLDRSLVPAIDVPDGEQELAGRIMPPPATGLLLGEHVIETVGAARYRVQRVDIDELREHGGKPLLPYVVRLAESGPGAYRIDEVMPGAGRERHLGYAFQWFALAATLLVIYLLVNLKKREN